MAARAVTIKDVAARAGVSVSTASRVLSGAGSTSADAEERVHAASVSLGYRINLPARSLRARCTHTIALLIPDVRNPFFAELAHGIEQCALAQGYVMLLGNADERSDQQDRYVRATRSLRVDGLIVAPQGEDHAGIDDLQRDGVPLVFVDRTVPGMTAPAVTSDPTNGITAAVEHLAERGHRRVGCIAGPQHSSTGRRRLDVFRAACAGAGLPLDDALIHVGDFQTDSGSVGTHRLIDAGAEAIVAADGPMTLGALHALAARRLRAGRDISLIGFDDLRLFALTAPPLTVIAHDVHDMAARAFDLLLRVMGGESPAPVEIPTTLTVRGSTRDLTRQPTPTREGGDA